jgi:hypothetical protein
MTRLRPTERPCGGVSPDEEARDMRQRWSQAREHMSLAGANVSSSGGARRGLKDMSATQEPLRN